MVVAGEAQQNNEHCHARSSRSSCVGRSCGVRVLKRIATAFAAPAAGPSPTATGAAFHAYMYMYSSSDVTFCSALSQHHVVKRFFFDTERSVSRTIVLQLLQTQTHAQCAQATQRGVQGSRVQQRPAYVAAKTTHVTKQHQIPKHKRVYFIWERWLANAFHLVSENRT